MGDVTEWPTSEEAQSYDVTGWLEERLPDDFQEDKNFHEDDEYEEEGWEWGPLFGFSSQAPEMQAVADMGASDEVAPLDDVPASMALVAVAPQPSTEGTQPAGEALYKDTAATALDQDKLAAELRKAKHDKHFSPEYWMPPLVPGDTRNSHLDEFQSDWIMEQLAKWQDAFASGDRTKKFEGKGSAEFYRDMRCDGIDAGILQKWHCQSICSSHIKSKLRCKQ